MSAFDDLLEGRAFFQDPYPAYRRLRAEAPVYWSDALGAWVLTRYDDVVAALRDPRLYSSAGRVAHILRHLPDSTRRQIAAIERHYEVGLAHSDPPAHTRLRALLVRVFTPRSVEAMRGRIQSLVDELLDRAAAQGGMDAIHDLAYPLPATVIAEMLGAPAADIEQFRRWANGINGLFEGGGRARAERALAAQEHLLAMRAYIADLLAERRAQPRDDIISGLAGSEASDERLSEAELVSTVVTLFVAGHETTTHLIGNGLIALLRHPAELRRLRAEPGLMERAIEEMLRYDTPVPRGWRIAREDVSLRGERIRAGDLVFPMLGAANRDPDQFANPETFDLARAENRHLGFGHGIHFCLGAPLARIEAPVAIGALLSRFPDLRLASEALTWRRDIALRGVESLPLSF